VVTRGPRLVRHGSLDHRVVVVSKGERRDGALESSLISGETLENTAAQVRLSGSYLLYMTSSGVLASVALLSNSVPILIGAMIVAPLMPPLALVAFALVADRRAQAWMTSRRLSGA
jgi:hypothetical protein